MSAGNACAAIGLANTYKIPAIGAYVQDIEQPVAPGADGPNIGPIGPFYWTYNWLGEEVAPDYVVPSTDGAATGNVAQWVMTDAELTVPADGLLDVVDGIATALETTGTFYTYLPAGTVVPEGAYFWAFTPPA